MRRIDIYNYFMLIDNNTVRTDLMIEINDFY